MTTTLNDIHSAALDPAATPDSPPLPCELVFAPAARAHRAEKADQSWFDSVAAHWGAPVKRIDPESLDAVTMRRVAGKRVALPRFTTIDPFASGKITPAFVRGVDWDDSVSAIRDTHHVDHGVLDLGGFITLRMRNRQVNVTAPSWAMREHAHVDGKGRIFQLIGGVLGIATALIVGFNTAVHPAWCVVFGILSAACAIVGLARFIDEDTKVRAITMRTAIPGMIPPEARALIHKAKEVANRTRSDVRLIVEADWKLAGVTDVAPKARDPLIVLIKGDNIALLGRFDCTAAEEYVAREHAVRV